MTMTQLDITGLQALEELSQMLHERGAKLVAAGRMTETNESREARRRDHGDVIDHHYPTMQQALQAFRSAQR
jgi:MFS superfamily sulfate permease-like transporter